MSSTAFTRIHAKRLLKLARHLERGKIGHLKFYFGQWHRSFSAVESEGLAGITEAQKREHCGYSGCAIGECPVVFPRYWKFTKSGNVRLRERVKRVRRFFPHTGFKVTIEFDSARQFFRLEEAEAKHLFMPNAQDSSYGGAMHLNRDATRLEVADNVRAFVKHKGF